jgi:hypothetical protein
MRENAAWLALIALTMASLCTPMLSADSWCLDCDEAECCELVCALCTCCSHLPRTAISGTSGTALVPPAHAAPEAVVQAHPEPSPRKIFHVPKPLA